MSTANSYRAMMTMMKSQFDGQVDYSELVRRVTHRAGITKVVGPHTLRHAFITAALDAGVPPRDVQDAASHAPIPGPQGATQRASVSLDRHATYIVAAFVAGAAR